MKTNPPTIRRDTRVFISAVSRELGSVRKLVKKGLEDNDYHAVEQDNFPPDYRQLVDKLRERIASCDAVLHIAGYYYGAEPQQRPDDAPRRSYTQLEYDLAVELGKPVYVFLTANDFPTDPHEPEDEERTRLQAEHRQRLISTGQDYSRAATREELDQKIRSLQFKIETLQGELTYVDAHVAATSRRLSQRFAIGVTVVVVLVAGIGWGVSKLRHDVPVQIEYSRKKTDSKIDLIAKETKKGVQDAIQDAVKELTNPIVLAERIRREIHATAEEKIRALPDKQGRGQLIAEIETERDLALGRVDDLIKLIQEGLREGASPVFQRAAEILETEGTDAAIDYLEKRRPATLETARRHAEQAKIAQIRVDAEKELRNRNLLPLILEDQLLESKLDRRAVLTLRELVSEVAPDWWFARSRLGMQYLQLAKFQDAEPHLRAAVQLATDASEQSLALIDLAMLLKSTDNSVQSESLIRQALAIDEQNHGSCCSFVERDLTNLAVLLYHTNRMELAEPIMRRTLAIGLDLSEAYSSTYATNLSNMAMLLESTRRYSEAESLLRGALVIDDANGNLIDPDHATHISNLAQLLEETSRLAETEPMQIRSVILFEYLRGSRHPDVAAALSNLAMLLLKTNRPEQAELLMLRAFAIDDMCFGESHTTTSRDLGNLSQVFHFTKRLHEAEILLRRALSIDEQQHGPEHPEVAVHVVNLAQLFQDSDRETEVDVLMRHAISIFGKFQRKTNLIHQDMPRVVALYRNHLQKMNLPESEIEERISLATNTTEPLVPVSSRIEKLLGRAISVKDVLSHLNSQNTPDGRPLTYFLSIDEPIAPFVAELAKPNATFLNSAGLSAFRDHRYADAIVLFDEAVRLRQTKPENMLLNLATRMNRASALRDLGETEVARDDLRSLVSELDSSSPAIIKGRAHFHLAVCEQLLGDKSAARREAIASLKAYGDEVEMADPKSQTERLLVELNENRAVPPRETVDVVKELAQARVRFLARAELASLPLDQSPLALLDKMLGPTRSTTEVFELLDRQYREQGKPAIWFLPLTEPISPHLDELLGPGTPPEQSPGAIP